MQNSFYSYSYLSQNAYVRFIHDQSKIIDTW